MLTGNPTHVIRLLSGEALEAFRFVKFSANTAIYTTGANDDIIGITQEKVASGKYVDVAVAGTSALMVDATTDVEAGDLLISENSTGYGQKIGSTAATTYKVGAIALADATSDGEEVLVLIARFNSTTPA